MISTPRRSKVCFVLSLLSFLSISAYVLGMEKTVNRLGPTLGYIFFDPGQLAIQEFRLQSDADKDILKLKPLISAILDPTELSIQWYSRLWMKTYAAPSPIPKYLHFTAKRSHFENPDFIANLGTWTSKNAEYKVNLFDDDNALLFVKKALPVEVARVYENLPEKILQADLFRYIVLLVTGGVYADTDTECIRPIHTWAEGNATSLIIGVEADIITSAKTAPPDAELDQQWVRMMQFQQWTIASEPGHPILARAVWQIMQNARPLKRDDIEDWTFTFKKAVDTWGSKYPGYEDNVSPGTKSGLEYGNRIILIEEMTGPALWTDSILTYMFDQYGREYSSVVGIETQEPIYASKDATVADLTIFPLVSFSPDHPMQKASSTADDPRALVDHKFNSSWQ